MSGVRVQNPFMASLIQRLAILKGFRPELQTYQVGAHFEGLDKGVLMHGSLKGGNASPLCLHFCYVQRRPRISHISPGYVINFKLRILSIGSAK